MNFNIWPSRSRAVAATAASAIAALALLACAKDAESREAATPAARAAAPAIAPDQATAVAIEPAVPPPAPGSAAVEPAGADQPIPAGDKTMGDKSYTLTFEAPDTVAKGASGTVRLTVLPKKGWKMNKEFPTKLKVTAPVGVTLKKGQQTVADAQRFDDHGATFAVEFTADSAGKKSFEADFKFAVCTDATCDPKRQKLAWVVDVP